MAHLQTARKQAGVFTIFILCMALPKFSFAATLETLVMPGSLNEVHRELESKCGNCHTRFDRSSQKKLCVDCHEDIKTDQALAQRFHGLFPAAVNNECNTCHSDHQGRDADIVGLSMELFNHSFTNFNLDGAHADSACSSCHISTTPFRETSTDCVSCHDDQDQHDGNLGSECGNCHSTASWLSVDFDHTKGTSYELTGKHLEATCSSCHVGERYEETSDTCNSCHTLDDIHNGSRGETCNDCHTTETWENASFNHSSETGYPLNGAHQELQCANCHLNAMTLVAPPVTCVGCHGASDPHTGQNGSACASCHSKESWKTVFDHLAETGFALQGAHEAITCTTCHTGKLTDELPTSCDGCHSDRSPHGKELFDCTSCHINTNWSKDLRFHHDLTDFPLLGAHRTSTCDQCHDGLKFSRPEPTSCVDCHKDSDIHQGTMGDSCAGCHSPAAWELWTFSHNLQTEYQLTGVHNTLSCAACHQTDKRLTEKPSCKSCHKQDDVHRGSFGTNCQRCHTTDSFTGAAIRR